MVEQKVFNGIMNLDDANDVLPSRHHKYAMNIKFRGNAGNMMAENINGNTLITNSLPAGSNQCIGAIFDEVKNRIYYFNYNSLGSNGIYYYDTLARTISPVLISLTNSGTDIFNFNPLYPIPSINILYKDAADGDVLYWVDRLNRPKYLNVKDATSNLVYSGGTNWLAEYLTVAKKMPLIPAVCSYYDKSPTSTINNLKTALYQFKYRWIYRDSSKSTWSPWSKLFTPKDVDSLATETNQSKNNEIQATIYTGPADCTKIEIGARRNLSSSFGDTILIDTLDKSILDLGDNAAYIYKFYNDSAYDYVDPAESILLYDYVPKKSNSQELINGNLLIYGGITEGNNPEVLIDSSVSLSLITNVQNNATPLSRTLNDGQAPNSPWAGAYTISFAGVPVTGDIVTIYLFVQSPIDPVTSYAQYFYYTVLSGDTLANILTSFNTQINASPIRTTYKISSIINSFTNSLVLECRSPNTGYAHLVTVQVAITLITPPGPTPTDISSAIYKHNSRYTFGLVYFDEFGVTNGVMTTNNLKVLTPEVQTLSPNVLSTNEFTIPSIQVSINNRPPSWAKYFSFVRTNNITVNSMKTVITDTATNGSWKDANYGYLNITTFNTNTDSYPTYDFIKGSGDRVRILGIDKTAVGTVIDYPILDLLTDKPAGSPFQTTGFFLKFEYDSTTMSGWTTPNSYYIEIYKPGVTTDPELLTFYEFGETYDTVLDSNNQLSHGNLQVIGTTSLITAPSTLVTATLVTTSGNLSVGVYKYIVEFVSPLGNSYPNSPRTVTTTSTQLQVNLSAIPIGATGVTARKIYRTKVGGSDYYLLTTINDNTTTTYTDNIADTSLTLFMPNPGVFSFFRGDFYSRARKGFFTWILDQSVSDKYLSRIVGNGRPFVIDSFAKEIYNPTLVRYGGSYQQGTLVNAINRFYFLNFEEYDRQKGDIQRLKLKEKILRIFQSRGTGVVNVYATEMTNQDGSSNLIGSTSILNPINYYAGQYGIGNQFCSLTSSSSADYYVDPINGYHIRLGRDGNTALSELYKGQYFFPSIANKYLDNYTRAAGGNAKILGVYDNFEEEYVSIFQVGTKGGVTLPPYAVGFSEKKNAYSSFYSYEPEWIQSAENVLVSWKNGGLYVHDSATKNTFYGTYTKSSISLVFNENNVIKKTFDNITIDANDTWDSATMGDVNTSLGQTSNLIGSDYEIHEGFRHAALMRDSLSLGGIINGDYLKGTWIEVKLSNSATNLVYLSGLYMGEQASPRNF